MFFLNIFIFYFTFFLNNLLSAQTISPTQADQSTPSTFFTDFNSTSTNFITYEITSSLSPTTTSTTTTTKTTTKTTTTTKWNPNNCGIPVINPFLSNFNYARIINGETAIANSWPWQVSLRFFDGTYIYNHFCGGTLISLDTVLTAAHCVLGVRAQNLVVLVGMHSRAGITRENVAFVRSLTYNTNFKMESLQNGYDVALIKLKSRVVLSSKVQIACLPSSANDFASVYNKIVVAIGWGQTKYGAPMFLQQTALKVSNLDAQTECASIPFNRNNIYCLKDKTTRASSTCFGDSGGPILFYSNKKWFIYGITSYAFADETGCISRLPAFFTAVPSVLSWINYWKDKI